MTLTQPNAAISSYEQSEFAGAPTCDVLLSQSISLSNSFYEGKLY